MNILHTIILILFILLAASISTAIVLYFKYKHKRYSTINKALKTSKQTVDMVVDNMVEDNKNIVRKLSNMLGIFRNEQTKFYTDEIDKLNNIIKEMNTKYAETLRTYEGKIDSAREEGKNDVMTRAKELERHYKRLAMEYTSNLKKMRKDASILISLYNLLNEQYCRIDSLYGVINRLVEHYSEGAQITLKLKDRINESKKILPAIENDLTKLEASKVMLGLEHDIEDYEEVTDMKKAVNIINGE